MPGKQRVTFLYRAAHSSSGSKIMRCDQLCEIARCHLGDRYEFDVLRVPKQGQNRRIRLALESLQGAIVIVLKRAYVTFGPGHLEILKKAARSVVIDHVDASIDERALEVADLHIAASVDGLLGMKSVVGEIAPGQDVRMELLLHHADPRIDWRDARHDRQLTIGYFGLRSHAVIPDTVESSICVPDYGSYDSFADIINEMQAANVHYAVRPPKAVRSSWKPFTKGANAAAAGANVLVHREVDDAVALLGADYPFLIEDWSAAAITDGINRLKAAMGTKDWSRGLDHMDALRERTSAQAVARDLGRILDSLD